jgi:hypothetical protein
VVGFRELGLVNAYTMEASFAGAAVGKYAKQHFNTGVYAVDPVNNSSICPAVLMRGVSGLQCAPK